MEPQQPPLDVKCPIAHRVHTSSTQHNLKYLSTVVQQGTQQEAYWFECEFNGNRFFLINGLPTDRKTLLKFRYYRPHWGWKD